MAARKLAKRPSDAQRSFMDAMPKPTRPAPIEHHCSACGSLNASFGEGVNIRSDMLGTWLCFPCWQERNP